MKYLIAKVVEFAAQLLKQIKTLFLTGTQYQVLY